MADKKLNTKGTRGQDLAAARAELRAFRHDVAILKRKGLIDKAIDARKIKPTKYLKSQIRRFSDVVEGKATSAKVSKKNAAEYKRQGYTVKNGRVIVPKMENERVTVSGGDFRITAFGKGGSITRVNLKFDKRDLNTWIEALRNNKLKIRDDEALAVQIFGHNMSLMQGNEGNRTAQEALADWMETYPSFRWAIDEAKPDQEEEYAENLILYRVRRAPGAEEGDFERPKEHPVEQRQEDEVVRRRKQKRAAYSKKRRENMGPVKLERYLDERAYNEQERRARMTPKEKQAYNDKAKERMAKLRSKRREAKK